MSDWTRSFLALLAEAGVYPRLADGRLVARLDHLPPLWAEDCRELLRSHAPAIVAELRSQEGPTPPADQARRPIPGRETSRTRRPTGSGFDSLADAIRGHA